MSFEIKHDSDAGRFYADIDGSIAHLDYVRVDERTLDLRHTYVPEALRGRGLAGQIVRFALTYARENSFKVIPTCSYVAATLQRDPSYSDIVVN
jgi:predicted GNAT family acetyltransferase